MVVALGADYDFAATPGMAEATEFYTFAGATRLGKMLTTFTRGHVLIAVGGAPFKCPPAPSEAALMMHDYLTTRGIRSACEITLILPLETPVPPSPRDFASVAGRVRGTAYYVRRRPRTEIDGHATPGRDHRRRPGVFLRPVPRRPGDPRPENPRGKRHDRGRVCAGQAQDAGNAFPGRLCRRRLRATGDAESRYFRRGRRTRRRNRIDRALAEPRDSGDARGEGSRATSSLAAGGSAASTWTSFPIPMDRRAPITSRQPPCAPRRSTSVPAAAPGGLVCSKERGLPCRAANAASRWKFQFSRTPPADFTRAGGT